MKNKKNSEDFHPESLMMTYGYNPFWSEGAVKCPIYQSSTFVFKTAEEGKAFFELAYGLRDAEEGEQVGLIYSRLNNPNLQILEERLCLWDEAEAGAIFESGMSAISTVLMEFLGQGDIVLHSIPLYGGTTHFIEQILPRFGASGMRFTHEENLENLLQKVRGKENKIKMIFIETPANPTNTLIDIEMCSNLAEKIREKTGNKPLVVVDNTYLGPVFQHPLKFGADLVIYSATKYIAGHSDLIAGAVLGSKELIARVKELRTFIGNMAGPWTGWLMMRSLETLKIRMETQAKNAEKVAEFLKKHPKVKRVYYLKYIDEYFPGQGEIFKKQCLSPGAMISFAIDGGEAEAFAFLNNLKLIKLAVSLGSTESLAEHPYSMTHIDVPEEEKQIAHITPDLIRLSIGVEHPDDLIKDIKQALEKV